MPISLSGIAAYLLLWAGTASGVATSSDSVRRLRGHGGRPGIGRRGGRLAAPVHETLSLAGLGVALLHASQSILAPEGARLDLLVFAGQPLATGWGVFLGVLALYLTVVATASFYLRRYLGGWWHGIHAMAYAAYGGALWHALAIGANAWLSPVRWLYLASAGVLAALTVLRIAEMPRWAVSGPRGGGPPSSRRESHEGGGGARAPS